MMRLSNKQKTLIKYDKSSTRRRDYDKEAVKRIMKKHGLSEEEAKLARKHTKHGKPVFRRNKK